MSPQSSTENRQSKMRRPRKPVQAEISEIEKREKLDEFKVKWCQHKPGCAKVNGGRQLQLGEPGATVVAAQQCTCGLWREWEEILWMLFPYGDGLPSPLSGG